MKWLYSKIRGFYLALSAGVPLPERGVFNFWGPGVTVTDDPAHERTDVYISGSGGVTFSAVKAALEAATATVGLNGWKLTNLATPTTTADAATKGYVDGLAAPKTRTITAGAGLTGGGDLTADRTINVAAADGSIIVGTDDIRVGVISDSQHGARGGDALHALAVPGGDAGFMSGAQAQDLASFVAAGVPFSGTATTGAGFAVGGAADNGSGAIRISATAHPLATNDRVLIHGVGGVSAANDFFKVTKIDADHFDLQGSAFAGLYTSGGTVLRCTNILTIPCPDEALTEIGHLRVHTYKTSVGFAADVVRMTFTVAGGAVVSQSMFGDEPVDADLGVFSYGVAGATDDGSGHIKLQLSFPADLWSGDKLIVANVGGVPAATGTWTVTRIDDTHFVLVGSTWSGSFTGGGTAEPKFRRHSVSGEWSAGVMTLWAIGHATESLDWAARAYEVF